MRKEIEDALKEYEDAIVEYTLIMAQDTLDVKYNNKPSYEVSLAKKAALKNVRYAKTNLVRMIENFGG